MALEIVGVERKVSVGPNPGMKFMAKLKKGRKVPMSQVYKDITDLSSYLSTASTSYLTGY